MQITRRRTNNILPMDSQCVQVDCLVEDTELRALVPYKDTLLYCPYYYYLKHLLHLISRRTHSITPKNNLGSICCGGF